MKLKALIFLVVYPSVFLVLSAQDYNVSLIPESLKENAHSVIRIYERELELKSINSGTERIKKVITILDKDGESDAYLIISYDKDSRVNIKQIIFYDSNGKLLRKAKSSEVTDIPAYSNYALYSDDRIKYFKPDRAVYPYSVEYVYEENMTNLISYGYWRPFSNYNISSEYSRLRLIYPDNLQINKREVNVTRSTTEIRKDLKRVETWEIGNIIAIEDEPFDVSISEQVPGVYLMPGELKYDNFSGKANTWGEYGSWIYNLYLGKNELLEKDKVRLDELLDNVPDTLEQIQKLYKYMQDNTRYVAISLGIGGFQPYDAKTVSETGYGDCKALTNYMYSLLQYKGITSFPALVSAGTYRVPIFKDFPNFQQFNHVILCVPYKKDTIWLECTSQITPFGFLGDFTDNRDVLLLTKSGGKFSHTKKYEAEENIRSCSSIFTIDSAGYANGKVKTNYTGLKYGDMTGLLYKSYDDQKKWLYANLALPDLQITDFEFINNNGRVPSAGTSVSFNSKNYGSFSGKYLIIPLNLIDPQKPIRKLLKTRNSDFIISRSSIYYDTLIYQLPEHFNIESIPEGKSIKSDFGEYSYEVQMNQNEIIYIRKLLFHEGRFNSSVYNDFCDFISLISKSDNAKVMLSRQ